MTVKKNEFNGNTMKLEYNRKKHLQFMKENADHYFFNEEYKNALKKYEEILKISPRDAQTWHNHGAALFALSEYASAISSFNKSLKIKLAASTLLMKATALENIGNAMDAIVCYDAALSIKTTDQELSNAISNSRKRLIEKLSIEEKIFYYRKYFDNSVCIERDTD